MSVQRLMTAVHHRLGARRVRLLACACCRVGWKLLTSERSRRAVALAERYADRLGDSYRMGNAYLEARKVIGERRRPEGQELAAVVATMAADPELGRHDRSLALAGALDDLARHLPLPSALDSWCAGLLRDLVPPASPAFDPAWRTADALALARRAYDDRDFSFLPVVGDALEEAGCDWQPLLDHCRSGERHARGC